MQRVLRLPPSSLIADPERDLSRLTRVATRANPPCPLRSGQRRTESLLPQASCHRRSGCRDASGQGVTRCSRGLPSVLRSGPGFVRRSSPRRPLSCPLRKRRRVNVGPSGHRVETFLKTPSRTHRKLLGDAAQVMCGEAVAGLGGCGCAPFVSELSGGDRESQIGLELAQSSFERLHPFRSIRAIQHASTVQRRSARLPRGGRRRTGHAAQTCME
jgi:hypothetical protein